jgi:Zn-dependent peptidase ImmA (M78 family)
MNRKDIETRATEILRDHGLLDIPVDPLRVAKSLGIKVMNAVFSEENKSGAIVKRGDIFSIYVNANDSPARKRFTIAHEIGHKLLHMDSGTSIEFVDTEDNFRTTDAADQITWTNERQKEWEANAFASALLMSEALVRAEWEQTPDPEIMTAKFQVSLTAMVVRLNQLRLLEGFP